MKGPAARVAMRAASSLTNRIFLACTLLVTLSLGLAFYFVNLRATADAELELRRGLLHAAALADQQRAALTDTYMRLGRLVADIPKLKAAVDTFHAASVAPRPREYREQARATIEPLAREYREQITADLLVLTDPAGTLLAAVGEDAFAATLVTGNAGPFDEVSTVLPLDRGLLQIVSVPILLGLDAPDVLGRLTVGFLIDDDVAARFRGVTGSEIAFGAGGRVLASSLPPAARPALSAVMTATDITSVTIGDEEFLALARPLYANEASAGAPAEAPVRLILRSRTERLRFLNTLRWGLAGALVVTLLLATILSYGVARTMTRPLATVTSAMREVAATGDFTRRVPVRSSPWDDEDARLLGAAFNTLTESIARFQHEAAQRERLSALGRLSTVIAHEIRNPLMIIRASLRTLRREHLTEAELREAVADIDEEAQRLNHIVSEVLDFARPIRFELNETNLNDVCRSAAAAAWAEGAGERVRLDLDPDLPATLSDAERLRTALVNILTNARHAVEDQGCAIPCPAVVVATRRTGDDRATITVRDRGTGIAPEDVAHIFDPYFTTRRTGTGLGLPIAKNIIEGLGGRLSVASRPGEGTEVRIDLPLVPAGAAV